MNIRLGRGAELEGDVVARNLNLKEKQGNCCEFK